MKTVVRHETQEDFFARMTSLAQKLDRGEQVEACENVSFEDHDEMTSFNAEQEKKQRKASLTLILGGGGKTKPKVKVVHSGALRRGLSYNKAVWISASDTFDREARLLLRKYQSVVVHKLDNSDFFVSAVRLTAEKPRAKQIDK